MLDVLLPLGCSQHRLVRLCEYEYLQAVSFGETVDDAPSVLLNSTCQVGRNTCAERAVGAARHDVEPRLTHCASLAMTGFGVTANFNGNFCRLP